MTKMTRVDASSSESVVCARSLLEALLTVGAFDVVGYIQQIICCPTRIFILTR